jgi:hypothetical protein
MSQVTETVCERIRAQGFCGLDDEACVQINYPLRLSPAICMIWAAVFVNVSTGFCIPSFIVRIFFGKVISD